MAGWIWILVSIIALLIVAAALLWQGKSGMRGRITPLTGIAWACIIGGIVFDSRWVAYSLFAFGIALAIADIFVQRRKAQGT